MGWVVPRAIASGRGTRWLATTMDDPGAGAGPGGPRPRHIPAECDRCGARLRPHSAAAGAPFGDEWACPACGRVRPDWPGIYWSPTEAADVDVAPPPPAGPPGAVAAVGPGYLAELDAWLGQLLGWLAGLQAEIEGLRADVRAAAATGAAATPHTDPPAGGIPAPAVVVDATGGAPDDRRG